MKKLILLIMLPFCALSAMAQDMLVTNDGKSMTIYNLEISEQSIFFQLSDKADAPLQKMLKKDVLIIKKADGTKLDLDAPQTAEKASQAKEETAEDKVPRIINVTIDDLSEEGKKEHETWWNNHSSYAQYTITDEKDREQKADCVEMWIATKKGSIGNDGSLRIITYKGTMYQEKKNAAPQFYTTDRPWTNPSIKYTLKNESKQTIYIDLGNTFFIRMGRSHCFYTPSSTTTTQSNSTGVGINVGAVANALGIGGAAGTLASGVNVGGGSTSGTTTTTYAQRIIALAPNASIDLEPQCLFDTETENNCPGFHFEGSVASVYVCTQGRGKKFMAGDECRFTEETSPLHWNFIVAYSTTEDCQALKTFSWGMYLKQVFGYKHNPWTGKSKTNYVYGNAYGHKIMGGAESVEYETAFPKQ